MSVLFRASFEGFPPSANCLKQWSRVKKLKRWKKEMAPFFQERYGASAPYSGFVRLNVRFVAPNFDIWDVDNRLKALLDAFVLGGVLADDFKIWDVHARREYGDGPLTVIVLKSYAPVIREDKQWWRRLIRGIRAWLL